MAVALVGNTFGSHVSQAFMEICFEPTVLITVREGTFAQISHAFDKFPSQINGVVFERGFDEVVAHFQFVSRCPHQLFVVKNQLFLSVFREEFGPCTHHFVNVANLL